MNKSLLKIIVVVLVVGWIGFSLENAYIKDIFLSHTISCRRVRGLLPKRVQPLSEEDAHNLAVKVNEALGGEELISRGPFSVNGQHYGVEVGQMPIDTGPLTTPAVVRIGPLIFVVMFETDRETTPEYINERIQELKAQLGELYQENRGNIFFATPSFYGVTISRAWPLRRFTLSSIAAMLSQDLTDTTVIDMGAGDGILARVALGLGARRLVLVEKNELALERAKVFFNSQGWSEGSFLIHQGDFTKPDFGSFMEEHRLDQTVDVALVNIGPWPEYGDANRKAMEMVSSWQRVSLVVNSGYLFTADTGEHIKELEEISEMLKERGFQIVIFPYGAIRTLIGLRNIPRYE